MSPVISGGSGSAAASLGSSTLVYRFTVTGSVKASIDTGVDVAQAGLNDWTNADLLEVYFYGRTDEAVLSSVIDFTFNNDASALYDRQGLSANNASVASSAVINQTSIQLNCPGASRVANAFGLCTFTVAAFGGTTGLKPMLATQTLPDNVAANMSVFANGLEYRTLVALTRLKVVPDTALKNFAVGSQLLIYKRSAS